MKILRKLLTALLLFLSLFTAPSTSYINYFTAQSYNRNRIIYREFEYSRAGYVNIAVSSVEFSPIPIISDLQSQSDPSRAGFFLLHNGLEYRFDRQFELNRDLCALDIKFITVLFTFKDLSPPPHSSFNKSYHVTFPGKYSLLFTNCNELSRVKMDVRTELYNTNFDGTKDYLSAEQKQPSFYFNFFRIYLCFLGFWICLCFYNRKYFQRLHLIMGVLLVMTIFHLYYAAADQEDLKVTGTHYQGWYGLVNKSKVLRNVLLLIVIVLMGAGRCIRKQLTLFTLTFVILLHVWASIRSGSSFFVIDIVCCFVVIIHTVCLIPSKVDMDTSSFVSFINSLSKVSVRPVVLCGLCWVYITFMEVRGETGALLFYLAMFYLFRPFDLDDVNEDKKCADRTVSSDINVEHID